MVKRPLVYDGQWFYPVHRGFVMECCSCSMTHKIDFKVDKRGWIAMRLTAIKRPRKKRR